MSGDRFCKTCGQFHGADECMTAGRLEIPEETPLDVVSALCQELFRMRLSHTADGVGMAAANTQGWMTRYEAAVRRAERLTTPAPERGEGA